jgi:hypothetical protein
LSSTSRPQERSESSCRLGSCCAPTRWLNEAPQFHHAPRRRGCVAVGLRVFLDTQPDGAFYSSRVDAYSNASALP